MIISGDYIAIDTKDDCAVPFLDDELRTPDVAWVRIDGLKLFCYEDCYRLIIDDKYSVELNIEAANKLITFMCKERNDMNKRKLDDFKRINNELEDYGYKLLFRKGDDGKFNRPVIEELKEGKCIID